MAFKKTESSVLFKLERLFLTMVFLTATSKIATTMATKAATQMSNSNVASTESPTTNSEEFHRTVSYAEDKSNCNYVSLCQLLSYP